MKNIIFATLLIITGIMQGCLSKAGQTNTKMTQKIPVIFDTDANNELDDQHALAYLLFSGNTFNVLGITVNATYNGGNIDEQYAEAERVVKLSALDGKVPLLKGANAGFSEIRNQNLSTTFDGSEAVNFIIKEAKNFTTSQPLVVLAVGKLTNVALALQKEPGLVNQIRVVWLGSNYPEPGEYNQDNDTIAMNFVLNTKVPFEMVTVRYGKPSGTDAVRATKQEIQANMPGKGPRITVPVQGRHAESFTTFGDYSVNLFQHIQYHGNPPSRALFDMAAVAIVKNPDWAKAVPVSAPILQNNKWVERPDNTRKILVWENFDKEKIMADFYATMNNYVLVR